MGGLDRMVTAHQTSGVATGDPQADALLKADGNAVLIGVLLDQQMQAEVAFSGPWKIQQRVGHLDMARLAQMDEEELAAHFKEKPAVHRYPAMMARRVQTLAQAIREQYDGRADGIWTDGADVETVRKRAEALPGFGKTKAYTLLHALQLFGHADFDIDMQAG